MRLLAFLVVNPAAKAFTPHAWWPDLAPGDPAVERKHRDGFELVRRRWPEVVEKANADNIPGRFVSFVAFEWHSNRWGDYHVLLPGTDGEICRAGTLEALQDYARQTGALLIPHHLGYRQGWRGANWETWRSDVSPVADGFSEHGGCVEAGSHFGMWGHSMGGLEHSQAVVEQWKKGRICGLLASTDNHWGCPANYGEGLAGIWAEDATRESVFEALRARRVHAVSGDRIRAWLETPDGPMGSVLPPDARRRFAFDVQGWDALQTVELHRNGSRLFGNVSAGGATAMYDRADEIWVVRIEFGWDGLDAQALTDWQVAIRVEDGVLTGVSPMLAGGGGSVGRTHRVRIANDTQAEILAYTSRRNARPTGGCVFRIRGSDRSRISVQADTMRDGEPGGSALSATLGSLKERTECAAFDNRFSSPKLSLGPAVAGSLCEWRGEFEDGEHSENGDFYHLKVIQRNGQCAWTSPIWFRDRNDA